MERKAFRYLLCLMLLLSLFQATLMESASATAKIKNGQVCKKGSGNFVRSNLMFRCINRNSGWYWTSSTLNKGSAVLPTNTQQQNIPATPLILPAVFNPQLPCVGSGEFTGAHPGWSSKSAISLTIVNLSNSDIGLYWCPAAAPNGQGTISYTVTSTLGGITCETILTSCELKGATAQAGFQVMATDETGSYSSTGFAIQNGGSPYLCTTLINFCNPGPGGLKFPTYGNVVPTGIGDCTFAAVANWEEVVLGTVPDNALIQSEFADAGGTPNVGLTNGQVFGYWQSKGIGGTLLNAALPFYTDPPHLMKAIDDSNVRAVIASLNLPKGQNFAGVTMQDSSYHWVVVDGYTPQGPLVATWGMTLQMTWQQWNLEVVSMWGITTRFEEAFPTM